MYDEPKSVCYNRYVLNQPGVHMFLCLYTMAVAFGVPKAFKNFQNTCNYILCAFQMYCARQRSSSWCSSKTFLTEFSHHGRWQSLLFARAKIPWWIFSLWFMTVFALSGIFKGNKTFRIVTQIAWDCIQNVKHRSICERWNLCLGIQRKRVIHKVENRLRLRNVTLLEIPEGKDTEGIL